MTPFLNKKRFILLMVFIIVTALIFLIKGNSLYDDEPGNFNQIKLFLDGKYTIYDGWAQFPGFPLIMALLGSALRISSIPGLRLINFFFFLASIYVISLIISKIDPESYRHKLWQFVFLPVFFPYHFLLYSESLAVLLIMVSFYLALLRKISLSGIAAILAVAVRQTNIVWLVFIFLLSLFDIWNFRDSLKSNLFLIKKFRIFIAGILLFLLTVIYIGGFTLGNQKYEHPDFYFGLGNFYWVLFSFSLLFAPLAISHAGRIFRLLVGNYRMLLSVLAFIITASLTFTNSHPWNFYPEHLRNLILLSFTGSLSAKLIFFSVVSYSAILIFVIGVRKNLFNLIFPFTLFSLAPIWLIESRYYLAGLVFWMLLRKNFPPKVEFLQSVYFLVLSTVFFYVYYHQLFYL